MFFLSICPAALITNNDGEQDDYSAGDETGGAGNIWIWPEPNGPDVSGQYASLYYAKSPTGVALLKAVQFEGNSRSYVEITGDSRLEASNSFTWLLYVFPAILQEAVILEYYGTGSGHRIQFLQNNKALKVMIYDSSGVLLDEDSKTGVLNSARWNFVGFDYISYNKIHIFKGDQSWKLNIKKEYIVENTFGNIRIGASASGTLAFNGVIGCVRLFRTKFDDKHLFSQNCNPRLRKLIQSINVIHLHF